MTEAHELLRHTAQENTQAVKASLGRDGPSRLFRGL